MVTLSNFNAKMNSLKELSKIIENCRSIPRGIVRDIDQIQYVEKVRTLVNFIAPNILKEDIEMIWKMQ
ncbi:unnamed protein product, partial [Rotaria magnacalcarata]